MKTRFDTSWGRNDTVKRARHGLPWTNQELARLTELYMGGRNLKEMSAFLQRPADGVINKLRHLDLINYDLINHSYYRVVMPNDGTDPNTFHVPPQLPKETTMNTTTPALEVKTFIFGDDATNMADSEIFAKIASIEGKIADLDKIQTKPKKLVAVIDGMRADIQKLVDFVDAR